MSESTSTTRIADRYSRFAEAHIRAGNVPALRRLLDDWVKDGRAKDDRLAVYAERLAEMEAIEREHGGFSLGVFKEPPPFRIRTLEAAARRERWSKRASELIAIKGPDWWAWAHRPCLP